jgi:hypothetical protein
MPSHFSTIGFALETPEQYKDLVLQAARQGDRISAPVGDYMRFAPGCGVELWVQVVNGNELIGCTPHFAGQGRMRLGVTQVITDQECVLDGGVHGWADPQSDDPASGCYPVFIAVPDFAVLQQGLPQPDRLTLQVAAFAHELTVYATEAAFEQDSERFRLASEAFIPSGLFNLGGEPEQPLRAEGIFAGHIVATELRTNPVTGLQFYWLLVQTLGAVIDVVADPVLVAEPPRVGGVAQGAGWLSGRVRDDDIC